MRTKQRLCRDLGIAYMQAAACGMGKRKREVTGKSGTPFCGHLPFAISSVEQVDGELFNVNINCRIDLNQSYRLLGKGNKVMTKASVAIPLNYPSGPIKVLDWGEAQLYETHPCKAFESTSDALVDPSTDMRVRIAAKSAVLKSEQSRGVRTRFPFISS